MIRRVIQIEEDKCNGCGACAKACHEGAIGMVNGKAKLMRDDYCDGLGDCLPACPMDAIHFIEREAAAYDEAAVLKNKEEKARFRGLFLFACFFFRKKPSFLKDIGVQKIWNNEQLYIHKYSDNVFLIYWNKC